jgi:hypothetical protein
MGESGIKGSGFESVVADVKRLLAEGRIGADGLPPEDRVLLEEQVLPSSWYPLSSYARFAELLLACEGGGDVEYLVERGRRAAERLYQAGLYRQLEATIERWGERFGPLMETLGGAMFRETRWSVKRADDATSPTHIEVDVPADFPECARHTSQGFIEFLGCHAAGARVVATSRRQSPTKVVFDVELD